jgi:hypothetical protein
MRKRNDPARRQLLKKGLAVLAPPMLCPALGHAQPTAAAPATRPIPSTGEQLPVVGLGSWPSRDRISPRGRRPPLKT